MRSRMVAGLVAVAGLMVGATSSAHAAASQSMVYIKGGNVWLANADGSSPHQVTTNGQATDPLNDPTQDSGAYHSPTEAADGTIWAPMGFALYHYNQNGTLIKEVVPPGGEYPLYAAVAPDDSKVVYNWDIPAVGSGGVLGGQTGSSVITSAGGASDYPDATRTEAGSWLSDSSTVILATDKTDGVTSTTEIDDQTPGNSEVKWFSPEDPLGADRGFSSEIFYSNQPIVDPTGHYLAVVEKSSYTNNATAPQLQVYTVNAAAPLSSTPTILCDYTSDDSYGFLDPHFTDDGSALAWYDSTGEQIVQMSAVAACGGDPGATTLAGISQASFSTAPNSPAPLPAPAPVTAPAPSPAPGPSPAAAKLSAASLSFARSLTRALVVRHGITAVLHCNTACTYAVVVGASSSVARKLGLTKRKRGQVVLGDRSGRFGGGKRTVTVTLPPKVLRALRRSRLKSIRLILYVAAKGSDGTTVAHGYTITIKR